MPVIVKLKTETEQSWRRRSIYGNKSIFFKRYFMNCIQYAVLIRAAHHTHRHNGAQLHSSVASGSAASGCSPWPGHYLDSGRAPGRSREWGSPSTLLGSSHPADPTSCLFPLHSQSHPIYSFFCAQNNTFIIELVHFLRHSLKTANADTHASVRWCECVQVRPDHHRAGTCTQREYPKSLLQRALRKTQLYTLFII